MFDVVSQKDGNILHCTYTKFHEWRCEIAKLAGLPPLDLMEGFYNDTKLMLEYIGKNSLTCKRISNNLPISWEKFGFSWFTYMLRVSDSEAIFKPLESKEIAMELVKYLDKSNDKSMNDITMKMVNGFKIASDKKVCISWG